tara:strand:- start:1298 stop:1684 length:387 start_codon:yes stop_codon:yes gene_type:complete
MTTCTELDLTADIIDVRDIIKQFEELEELQEAGEYMETPDCELSELRKLLAELDGAGGDEQWRGDWYPVTLIRDRYFKEYAQELAEDIGAVDANATWPNNCIDWEHAARELRYDYTGVDVAGVTYWTR